MDLRSLLVFFEDTLRMERYATRDSVVHRLDARAKLLMSLVIVLTAVTVTSLLSLVLLLASVAVLAAMSKAPPRYFLLRSSLFIPAFSLMIGLPFLFLVPGVPVFALSLGDTVLTITSQGAERLASFVARVWICVASMTLLGLTTRFASILDAMRKLRAPRLFVDTLMMTYRYLFLFVEEAYRMTVAREARAVRPESRRRLFKSLGDLLGALFIRAYERGERVYLAMESRGYPSLRATLQERPWRAPDTLILASTLLYCLFISGADFLRWGGLLG